MRLIDADALIKNILNWQKELKNDESKELLSQVIHCINAKDTVFDPQKFIDETLEQKLELEYIEKEDVPDAVIYNGAIEDIMDKIKYAMNPNCWKQFQWETKIRNKQEEEELDR